MSATRSGILKSQEHKEAIAEAMALVPEVSCPHCNKTGQNAAMKRHHFDRCKYRKQLPLF